MKDYAERIRTHGRECYDQGCRYTLCVERHNASVTASRTSRLARIARGDPDVPHGRRSTYDAGCRCFACREARRDAYRRLEAKP